MNPFLYSTLPGLLILRICVWAGAHGMPAVAVQPRAWREKRADSIRAFEGSDERIGVTGLGVLFVLTSLSLRFGGLPSYS